MSEFGDSCPDWLDGSARREWQRLHAVGIVARNDPATVAAYCWSYSLWVATRSLIARLHETGSTDWTTHEGQDRPHPAYAIEARLAADLLELSQALNIDPVGREAAKPSRVLFLDEGP